MRYQEGFPPGSPPFAAVAGCMTGRRGERAYKDKATDEWKDTFSYNEDDLLPMAELFRDAYAWIKTQRRADAKARREREAEPAA